MPPKRSTKLVKERPSADPVVDTTAIPPALPPSVEEAYRRKCVQLKQRTNEVEEENDATRIRLARVRRQIEKLRVERSFLLEQLAKRTSTNVEDSEGSPSPPPTPKDKPLRTKRGHRKPSMMAELEASVQRNAAASPFVSQNLGTMSPSSEAFSHSQAPTAARASQATNGASKLSKPPASAFELYCDEAGPAIAKRREEAEADAEPEDEPTVEEELEQSWKDLPSKEREEYQTKYDELVAEAEVEAAKKKKDDGAEDGETAAPEAVAKEGSQEKAGEESAAEPAGDDAKDKSKDADDAAAKEDEEMKDDDKAEAAAAPASKAATQDEDVEMADETESKSPEKRDEKME